MLLVIFLSSFGIFSRPKNLVKFSRRDLSFFYVDREVVSSSLDELVEFPKRRVFCERGKEEDSFPRWKLIDFFKF